MIGDIIKMKEEIIQQGAEAIIVREGDFVIKKRVKKPYRINFLDEKIRKLRTRGEGRMLKRASKVVSIPKIEKIDEKSKEIRMEFLKGKKLSENLNGFSLEKQKKICLKLGKDVSKLHQKNLIHGDLTTSNMILDEKKNDIYFIDFGLGFHSKKIEDRAVDLHLLRQALEAKHFENWRVLFDKVVEGYKKEHENQKEAENVIKRLKRVESRGRYKGGY